MPKGIYQRKSISLYERFMAKIEMIPECGCWIWIGGGSPAGYGKINLGRLDGTAQAHRVSWELHNGSIDIVKIRNDSRSQSEIAAEYSVRQTTISNIKLKKTWKSVA